MNKLKCAKLKIKRRKTIKRLTKKIKKLILKTLILHGDLKQKQFGTHL